MEINSNQQPPIDRLALLYHLAQTFNSTLDLEQVLDRVMDEVIIATRAERGFVMLRETDGRLSFQVARGLDQRIIDDPAFQVSRSVVENVAQEGKGIITYDAQTDERFSMRDSVVILGLRSVLCVPITLKNNILGVIYVDNRLQAGIFAQTDMELLSAIASNAAIAIENARLYLLAVEKGRLERELQMARQVQTSLLPTQAPVIPGWELAARWIPARQVSGDFYDFNFDSDGRLNMVIADVSDKGMPAALFMASTRTILRASVDLITSPVKRIERANRLICSDSANGMFVTMFYACLNPDNGQITYVNAGHNPPALIGVSSKSPDTRATLEWLSRTGMALGIMPEANYDESQLSLKPGDFLVMYTDGVIDALNSTGEPFGIECFQNLLLERRFHSASQIIAGIEKALSDYTESTDSFDDITLMIIKRVYTDEMG